MRSPTFALTWEIWRRGHRSAALVVVCILFSAVTRRMIPDTAHESLPVVFGILMALSFLFLLGLLNCTEFNSTREWNGFPYRTFVLPVPTWRLVATPMLLGLITVELLYFAWLKLVWTHGEIPRTGWYAVLLGAYLLYYQMILWSLAGFRILRTIVLSVGGVSMILVGVLPIFSTLNPESSPWLSESRLAPLVSATMPIAYIMAWIAVARQRHGGGRRRNWVKALVEWVVDHSPRRTKHFSSPAAAQFWFEWRRTGFLLPAAVGFGLLAIVPLSLGFRAEPGFTPITLCWVVGIPVILGTFLGKGLAKPDFYSKNLSLPPFLAVRPISATEIVVSKLKVAAISVLIAWFLVLLFIGLWLSLWADTSQLQPLLYEFRFFYPHSWHVIAALFLVSLMVLTWRCMINDLWAGLSGRRWVYSGNITLQVIVPLLVLLASAIWSDNIDRFIKLHPHLLKSLFIQIAGWTLAVLVIAKLWLAASVWSRVDPHRTRQYLVLWIAATLCLVVLAWLSGPPMDVERQQHIFFLLALLLFPFARVGIALRSLEKSRAQ